MPREFILSDLIVDDPRSQHVGYIHAGHVKEFIKRLKDYIKQQERIFVEGILPNLTEEERQILLRETKTKFSDVIDKIAGDKLI